jgi:hypothetical protein
VRWPKSKIDQLAITSCSGWLAINPWFNTFGV